ncbi:MAG: hypothetical protein INR71_08175, partial [Terriglobus roseus]|nr:hypothetical protein [Terriglobus roseus]
AVTEAAPAAEAAPAVEAAPATEAAPAAEETPAATEAKPEETAAAAVEEPKTNGAEAAEKKEEPAEKRRTSFFGNLGAGSVKKDKPEGEKGESAGQKLGGLFRNPSKLIRGQKEGKKAAAQPKVEEETKVADEAPKLDEPKKEEPLDAKTEADKPQASIGDVVPEAVQVGQPQAAPTVQAAA